MFGAILPLGQFIPNLLWNRYVGELCFEEVKSVDECEVQSGDVSETTSPLFGIFEVFN